MGGNIRRDLVSDVPDLAIGQVLHALLKDLHRRSAGADHATTNDALRQLEMVKAEGLHAFVEIEHALGDIVKPEEFVVTPVDVHEAGSALLQLILERVADARRDVQQGEKSGRVQPASMPQPGADDVVVVGRDGFENVQHRNRIFQHGVGAPHEPAGICVVALRQADPGAFQLPHSPFHQQFRSLVNDLERKLVGMGKLPFGSLQRKEIVGAEVAFVIGCALTFKNRLAKIHYVCPYTPRWTFVDFLNRFIRYRLYAALAQALKLRYKRGRRFSTEAEIHTGLIHPD